jgi:hypothetical protein
MFGLTVLLFGNYVHTLIIRMRGKKMKKSFDLLKREEL